MRWICRFTLFSVSILLISSLGASHAFTIPEWNQSQVSEYVPAQQFLEDSEQIERSHGSTFALGINHILDPGSSFFTLPTPFLNDHGMLLLGLILVPGLIKNASRKNILNLFELASSFALGHGLALFSVYTGLLEIPGFLVESGIAFSVAILAFERFAIIEGIRDFDLRTDVFLLFITGFWHGNGFAAVVENVSFSGLGDAVSYLFVFTLGVDAGQFIFMGASGALIYIGTKKLDEKKLLKTVSILLVVSGTGLGLFRLLPVLGGVI